MQIMDILDIIMIKKKLKEKLIKAIYHELTKDDDTAECLFDVVKQLQLSGEKIIFIIVSFCICCFIIININIFYNIFFKKYKYL